MPVSSPVRAIALYTLVEALRNRLVLLVLGFVLAGFVLAALVGEVAITETRQFQGGFLAAMLRACAVLTTGLFVVTSMVREFNDKGTELLLSLPLPRSSYLAGKLLGFSALGALVAGACGLALLAFAPAAWVAPWAASLAFELLLVTGLSLLCVFTFSQVIWALSAVAAFYVLARVMGALQLMAHGPLVFSDAIGQRFLTGFIDALAWLLPELYRFTRAEWVVYGDAGWADVGLVAGQSIVYLALIAGAALFDLYRKNF